MTDFSRNQIASAVKLKSNQIDRWVIPNDRQLSLRARLGSGWSVRTNRSSSYAYHGDRTDTLTEEELQHIHSVVNRAASLDNMEQQRIGTLVHQYDSLRSACHGVGGKDTCLLCGTTFSAFMLNSRACQQCLQDVCLECVVETHSSAKEKLTLCKVCSEKRELWKKTGAWFFGDIPHHTPASDLSDLTLGRSRSPGSIHSSPATSRRGMVVRGAGRDARDGSVVLEHQDSDIQMNVVRCKPYKQDSDLDDSDSDDMDSDGSTGTASYSGSLQRFKRVDTDTVSINSQTLKPHPMSSSKSADSLNTGTNEESATESLQDLRLLSMPGHSVTDKLCSIKPKAGVSFHPDTISQKSDGFIVSAKSQFAEGVPRCISIPNADLKDVDYHEEEDTNSPYGSLIFTLFYQELEETLEIEVLGAQHLPDTGVSYNPYVSINLVPSLGNSRRQRTRSESNTLQPKWKQKISYFGIPMDELLFKSLVFTVCSERMIGSDDIIGEHRMELRQVESYELTHYHVYMEQNVSVPTDEVAGEDIGKVQLSIRYETSTSQLYVGVVRCAALHLPNNEGYADPYVKLYLLPDSTKASKRKTTVKRRTLNPEFHEEFIYKVPIDSLAKLSLDVTVWDHNMTRNVFLGGIFLSSSSPLGSEKMQWDTIVEQTNRQHICWQCLRDTLNK